MECNRSDKLAPNPAASEACDTQSTYCESQEPAALDDSQSIVLHDSAASDMFPDSPVYDLPESPTPVQQESTKEEDVADTKMDIDLNENKRKLSDDMEEKIQKIPKLEMATVDSQSLDQEVSEINSVAGERRPSDAACASPNTGKLLKPTRSSPRKISKRSNSYNTCCDNLRPRSRSRAASAEAVASPARPGARAVASAIATIREENSADPIDSQNLHQKLSLSTLDCDRAHVKVETKRERSEYSSEPIVARDRGETLSPGSVHVPHSHGFECDSSSGSLAAHHKSRLSRERAVDQDTTDTASSVALDSPDPPSTLASKMITKLSNGDSSTPTEGSLGDITPDPNKNGIRGKRFSDKNESFRSSTTPSTISPQNGHSFPLHTPAAPCFDIHVGHDEDGEFLSMYIVRTDNDLGQDMAKEFQRLSKRFTLDPYLADISKSNSPSSVTSAPGSHAQPLPLAPPLHARSSFTSATSSSTSGSNRTSDGAFVVPPPPGRTGGHGASGVRGYRALRKKIGDLLSHLNDHDDSAHSEEKVSAAVQVSPGSLEEKHSNGTASPEEVSRCDRATPKSSLKKSKTRGRRPLPGKTKRALLPTQTEEPEAEASSPERKPETLSGTNTPRSAAPLRRRAEESPRPPTPLAPPSPPPEVAEHAPGTLVLAKWVDKRYYSGKVQAVLEPNKYLIEFDDGHSKALLEDLIVFGDEHELPLAGQSVYAVVDDQQTYEPALVLTAQRNKHGTVTYTCITDGETTVSVTASELYLTEDQARSLQEARPAHASPATPRRRPRPDLDLDNIIHGPRSVRSRDKYLGSPRRRLRSPASPQASTSGVRKWSGASARKRRPVSESSELSEGSVGAGAGAGAALQEEVAGVEPEVQRTPRKITGVKAGPLQLKGAARQTANKKNSKLNKFENDEDTVSLLGPVPASRPDIFRGSNFLLTYSGRPHTTRDIEEEVNREEASCSSDTSAMEPGSEREDREFTTRPFDKERLRSQLEAGGGVVYTQLAEVPERERGATWLVAARPCRTVRFAECLAAGVRALSHDWVVASCRAGARLDPDSFALPAGWSVLRGRFVDWSERGCRGGRVFPTQAVLVCGEAQFVKFWSRMVTLAGGVARALVHHQDELGGALALLTDADCPHQIQNKAQQEGVPLVSTWWVWACIIEGRVVPPAAHARFSFHYTDE